MYLNVMVTLINVAAHYNLALIVNETFDCQENFYYRACEIKGLIKSYWMPI